MYSSVILNIQYAALDGDTGVTCNHCTALHVDGSVTVECDGCVICRYYFACDVDDVFHVTSDIIAEVARNEDRAFFTSACRLHFAGDIHHGTVTICSCSFTEQTNAKLFSVNNNVACNCEYTVVLCRRIIRTVDI